jgi:hypothetical protein
MKRYRVTVLGGMPASVTYTFEEEPEERELDDLLLKHGATEAMVLPC